ncbi:hypothetical protein [Amycolatopsis acidicola]|uniref:hypothetical protein n=1 Tax=Amycolatopsis acidicola TaxID=2596893 RepID=UPI001FB733CE|nr:hypothetical protein [Amycolatopsis acidicola]
MQLFRSFALHLSPDDAAELDLRIQELLDEYLATYDRRLDQPPHGGMIVLHWLAE